MTVIPRVDWRKDSHRPPGCAERTAQPPQVGARVCVAVVSGRWRRNGRHHAGCL